MNPLIWAKIITNTEGELCVDNDTDLFASLVLAPLLSLCLCDAFGFVSENCAYWFTFEVEFMMNDVAVDNDHGCHETFPTVCHDIPTGHPMHYPMAVHNSSSDILLTSTDVYGCQESSLGISL